MNHKTDISVNTLLRRYSKLYKKIKNVLRTGQFFRYSISKKNSLLSRLWKYECCLLYRGVFVASTTVLLMHSGESLAQQPIKIGEEFRVNTETKFSQQDIAMDSDANGNFVVIWRSNVQDGSGYGVYGQRYSKEGALVGLEFQVNTETEYDQSNPSVGMDSKGNFLVVWQSYEQDSVNNGVFGQRFDDEGMKVGDEFIINTQTNSIEQNPIIGMNDSGAFVVIWQRRLTYTIRNEIKGQLYDSNGIRVGDEFLINTSTAFNARHPYVDINRWGDFLVVWESQSQDGSADGIYAQQFNRDGTKKGNEFLVNTETYLDQRRPAMSMDDDGDFVVVWQSDAQDGSDNGIYGQLFDSTGEKVKNEFLINTETYSNQVHPAVSMDDDGNFVVVWQSDEQDGSNYGVYGQVFNRVGEKIGNEFLVNTEVYSDQGNPKVTMSNDGDFVVAWGSRFQDENDYGVYAQRYKIDGLTNTLNHIDLKAYKVFPNPVKTKLFIDVSDNENEILKYRISNIQGVSISEETLENNEIDISALISGFYLIEIFNNRGHLQAHAKFIKNK